MKRLTYILLIGVLALSVGSGNVFAQATASGTIQGTVTDQTPAVVSGAQVEAKNKATGVTRTTTSNDTGVYQFELLPVGTYTVKVTKTGFADVVQTIEILIGQTATVNVELKTGSVSEIIEVTSEAPLLDQAKTSVSQNITPTQVEELPIVGRDVANLAYLAPGIKATDSYDPTKNRYAILSVNGAGGRNVNVTVNGVDNKDNTVGGPVMQLPLEAVQEFQISTQRFSAENGRSEGAAINMITKQGTNSYHGSVGQCTTQLGIPLSPLTIAKYDPLRGDPFFELDMRLAKNIKFGERMKLQLVAQAFNLTNRANYGNNFGLNIASTSTFGHPVGFINPSTTIVPRSVWGELGARFTF